LIAQLIAVAQQAGITGSALASLEAIQSGLPTSGGLGFTSGQRTGTNVNSLLQANEGARQREESRRAAERAAREQESAAKRAGKELESAAKRAGNELNSALQSVPGLFSASKVTQDQIDSAKAGIPQNFADDFLRRLRDVADNGTKRNDVSLDQARQALQNIGINPSDDVKQLVRQIEEAWNNSSLFAEGKNLDLINTDAVKAAIEQQQKELSGQASLKAMFGITDENLQQQSEALGQGLAAVFGGASETDAVKASGTALMAGITAGLSDPGAASTAVAGMADAMKTGNLKDMIANLTGSSKTGANR
jgi:hypothetical protein